MAGCCRLARCLEGPPLTKSDSAAGVRDSTQFIKIIQDEFHGFRIVYKRDSRFSKLLDVLLRLVTLGGQNRFMTEYHTVIGDTLFVPSTWDAMTETDRVILLRHERVHLRQKRRFGLVGMGLIYLFPIFPLGLAYGRARLEWEAYTETLRAIAELRGLPAARSPTLRAHIVGRFLGPDYGWMWPFRTTIEGWYDAALAQIELQFSPFEDPPARLSANQSE